MLTPQEVSGHVFSKSMVGGYNMAMVDEFLDELTDDYTALYKENAALKSKLKVLVEKVEDYRSTEDSMRSALLAAQKMADKMISEAEERKASMLADAELQGRAKIDVMRDELDAEQKRLNLAKSETASFIARTRAVFERQLQALDAIAAMNAEELAKQGGALERSDVSAIGEKILASYPDAGAGDGDTKLHTDAREPREVRADALPTGDDAFVDTATREIKIPELRFGRGYNEDK